MSEQALRVLVVDAASDGPLSLPAADAIGALDVTRCASLEAAAPLLASASFDVLALSIARDALAHLADWATLPRAVADATVLVLCDGVPDTALALRLVQLGVQDVVVRPAAPALTLRLAAERRTLQHNARKALGTDALTGLPDQAQLAEHMTQLLALREREPAPMALLAVRLEGLSTAEARFGREATNALRRKVAVRLRVGLRAGDVVAALGPDLLAVLLSRMQDAQDAEHVAGKLRQALAAPFTLSGNDVLVGAAIGAARYPQDGREAGALLRVATGLAATATAAGAIAGRPGAANDPS
ncbi:MAG: GGDEF domain-containing protein [Piscinibacter sp.]|nr:GGDEF domain-containing protein [Piscinibacter sp.]